MGALSGVSGVTTGLMTVGATSGLSVGLALLGPASAADHFLNDM